MSSENSPSVDSSRNPQEGSGRSSRSRRRRSRSRRGRSSQAHGNNQGAKHSAEQASQQNPAPSRPQFQAAPQSADDSGASQRPNARGNSTNTGSDGTPNAANSGNSRGGSNQRRGRRHSSRRRGPADSAGTQPRTTASGGPKPSKSNAPREQRHQHQQSKRHVPEPGSYPQYTQYVQQLQESATYRRKDVTPPRFDRPAPPEEAPYAVVSIQSSGIHPSTSRLVSLDIQTRTEAGDVVNEFHCVFDPGTDIGPKHLHGLTKDDIAQAPRYSSLTRTIGRFLDGRTVIMHNAPRTWGFIVSETRAVMRLERRHSKGSKGRGRKGQQRRNFTRLPRPTRIVDTLSTLRRQGVYLEDTRIRGCARTLGFDVDPAASISRAMMPEAAVSRESTELVWEMFNKLRKGELAERTPKEIQGDRFGLQRSIVRIDAANAPRPFINPGVLRDQLVQGMEIVVSPQIEMDPNVIIEAVARTGLAYSEKLTRQTSAVVCNQRDNLTGKAMHGDRKGISLVSDAEFMSLVEDVAPGTTL